MSDAGSDLLVDISNTRTKFALSDADGGLAFLGTLPTALLGQGKWQKICSGVSCRCACISSVVPQGTDILRQSLRCPVHVLCADGRLNLDMGYRTPLSLGADRLAAAMALAEQGALPAISVDAGTAVTCDVLLRQGNKAHYAGGAIAPGLRTMMQTLVGKTACLPEVALEQPPFAIGRDTAECLRSGLVFGFVDMVKGLIARLSTELQAKPRLILTGGDAELLARFIPDAEVDSMLVFKGLQIFLSLNA